MIYSDKYIIASILLNTKNKKTVIAAYSSYGCFAVGVGDSMVELIKDDFLDDLSTILLESLELKEAMFFYLKVYNIYG